MTLKFHERLRFERLRLGMAQGELARRVGLRQQHLARYELGHVSPAAPVAWRLLDALGLERPAGIFLGRTLGEQLRLARERAGLSKMEFARRLGLEVREIRRYEQDQQVPSIDRLDDFARALGVTGDELRPAE